MSQSSRFIPMNTTQRRLRANAPEFVPESTRKAIKNYRRNMALKIASLHNPTLIKELGKTTPALNPVYNTNIKAAYSTTKEAYYNFIAKKVITEDDMHNIVKRVCEYSLPSESFFYILDKIASNNQYQYLQEIIMCLSQKKIQSLRTFNTTLLTYLINNHIRDTNTYKFMKLPREIQLSMIQILLEKGVDVNESQYSNLKIPKYTPLSIAIDKLDLEVVQMLMMHGAIFLPNMISSLYSGIIKYIDKTENMPETDIDKLEEIIKILVENGIDLNTVYDNAGMWTIGSLYREKSILQKLNEIHPGERSIDFNRVAAVKDLLIKYGARAIQSEEKRRPSGGKRTMRKKQLRRTRRVKKTKRV